MEPNSEGFADGRHLHADFGQFKRYLIDSLDPSPDRVQKIKKINVFDTYALSAAFDVTDSEMAGLIASYLRLPQALTFPPKSVLPHLLPLEFCRWNNVAPVLTEAGDAAFLLSNPFDWELMDVLKKYATSDRPLRLLVGDPSLIRSLLDTNAGAAPRGAVKDSTPVEGEPAADKEAGIRQENAEIPLSIAVIEDVGPVSEIDIEKRPIVHISNSILYTAVTERASDIHIEPKEKETSVRYRIDGDLQDLYRMKKQTGAMVISRLKALAGLDIAERMRPQDGAVEIMADGRTFKLRLATTSTPNGESLVIRVLEPSAKPKKMSDLGMMDAQVAAMIDLAARRYGLILVVGPTGSGKTTTIYSFLAHVDTRTRSLISVEDPVEYRIPDANQQQVNEKAGVTFDALLKSSVRQDPDILYLGEIRDGFSARISVDFASTGHMTVSTLHTNNATTAIFRLERLGVVREVMAEALLGIVAQRLLKKLCPLCRKVVPITEGEKEILRPFTDEIPAFVAHPVGCPHCRDGYFGREGVYEIITFDTDILERIRNGMSISELRMFLQRRGDYLISHHAVDKVKVFTFSIKDVYEKILVEEVASRSKEGPVGPVRKEQPDSQGAPAPTILVVEDDPDNRLLMSHILDAQGYEVSVAEDGIDALMELGKKEFDLILSDVNMPNLDGFKFLELINQKGIQAPLVFLTARREEEDEVKGLELGALDYLKKPINKEALLLRVRRALNKRG